MAENDTDLRNRILRASIELIEEKGLAALSMREVARRAGVSHQAPYHHFEDREAIMGAVAEQGFDLLCAGLLRTSKAGKKKLRPGERLSMMGGAYVEFACKHPAHFRIMFRPELMNIGRCPGAQAAGDRAFGILTAQVQQAIEEGVPAEPSDTALITLVWSIAHGLACLILDGPLSMKVPEEAQDAHIRAVMKACEVLIDNAVRKKR